MSLLFSILSERYSFFLIFLFFSSLFNLSISPFDSIIFKFIQNSRASSISFIFLFNSDAICYDVSLFLEFFITINKTLN